MGIKISVYYTTTLFQTRALSEKQMSLVIIRNRN